MQLKFLRRVRRRWQLSGLKLLAHGYRCTGWRRFVELYCARTDILLTVAEVSAIAAALRGRSCALLVFGAGNDSLLWSILNRHGTTVFLEDTPYWIKEISAKFPGLQIELVAYTTKIAAFRELAACPKRLGLQLPPAVRERQWDVILVDAPMGWGHGPGRMQSIYESARLVAPGGTVFVHDCERDVEKLYTDLYLGRARRLPTGDRLCRFEM